MNALLESIVAAAAPYGLNLVAAVPCGRYDAAAPSHMRTQAIAADARTIVVIGNGGEAFWHSFRAYSAENPGWDERPDPLDDFTRAVIERSVRPVATTAGVHCTPVYPFMNGGPTLHFMQLGQLAGLAGPSIIGVAVNPVYGPWIAFRAALLLEVELDAPGPARGFDPCPTCVPRTCIAACPAAAIRFPAGWDIPRCLTHRVEQEPDCAPRCHARTGCVLGPAHRYPEDELAYHQARALRAMRTYYDAHIRPPSPAASRR